MSILSLFVSPPAMSLAVTMLLPLLSPLMLRALPGPLLLTLMRRLAFWAVIPTAWRLPPLSLPMLPGAFCVFQLGSFVRLVLPPIWFSAPGSPPLFRPLAHLALRSSPLWRHSLGLTTLAKREITTTYRPPTTHPPLTLFLSPLTLLLRRCRSL
jgi:hypothetical protein